MKLPKNRAGLRFFATTQGPNVTTPRGIAITAELLPAMMLLLLAQAMPMVGPLRDLY